MYKLSSFNFSDMMHCRSALRALFQDEPDTMGQGAERIVQFLHRSLVDDEKKSACALVRFFKMHSYADLDPELQRSALAIDPRADRHKDLKCLVLMATAGDEPEWNDRRLSRGHQAIPLASVQMVEQAPMIAQLFKQMGVNVATLLKPDPSLVLGQANQTFNVFHIGQAAGSPFIPAQKEFVLPRAIASVLGVGGILATGDLFAVILFSRVRISAETADAFKVLGLNLRVAVLPLVRKPLFGD